MHWTIILAIKTIFVNILINKTSKFANSVIDFPEKSYKGEFASSGNDHRETENRIRGEYVIYHYIIKRRIC